MSMALGLRRLILLIALKFLIFHVISKQRLGNGLCPLGCWLETYLADLYGY